MRIGEERRREARRGKERRGEERGFESSSLPPYLHRHQPLGEKHVGALNALDCRSTERNIKNHNAYNGNSKVQYFFYAFEWHVQDPEQLFMRVAMIMSFTLPGLGVQVPIWPNTH